MNPKTRAELWIPALFLSAALAACNGSGPQNLSKQDEQRAEQELAAGDRAAKAGKHGEAEVHFTRVLDICPWSNIAYDRRANAREQLGKTREAIEDHTKAIEKAEDNYKCIHYNNRARLHHRLGKVTEAENDFNSAIDQLNAMEVPHPGYLFDCYYNRASFFLDTGRPDRCTADCNKVLSTNPDPATRKNFEELKRRADR